MTQSRLLLLLPLLVTSALAVPFQQVNTQPSYSAREGIEDVMTNKFLDVMGEPQRVDRQLSSSGSYGMDANAMSANYGSAGGSSGYGGSSNSMMGSGFGGMNSPGLGMSASNAGGSGGGYGSVGGYDPSSAYGPEDPSSGYGSDSGSGYGMGY